MKPSVTALLAFCLCLLAVWLTYRADLGGISRELGLSAPVLPAIAFALVASLPMLIGFAITRSLTPHIEILLMCPRSMFQFPCKFSATVCGFERG